MSFLLVFYLFQENSAINKTISTCIKTFRNIDHGICIFFHICNDWDVKTYKLLSKFDQIIEKNYLNINTKKFEFKKKIVNNLKRQKLIIKKINILHLLYAFIKPV
jgi:hypothetical protein